MLRRAAAAAVRRAAAGAGSAAAAGAPRDAMPRHAHWQHAAAAAATTATSAGGAWPPPQTPPPPHGASRASAAPRAATSAFALAAVGIGLGVTIAAAEAAVAPPAPVGPGGEAAVAALPVYTRADVAAHNRRETRIWVTYKDGVYDITDFVANHPGGTEKILMASGGAVDAYWQLYPQHYASAAALAALARRRVGTLDAQDAAATAAALPADDPYASDPPPSPAMLLHARQPATAEPPLALLTHAWITPTDLFFIRSHHPVPPCGLAAPGCADAESHAIRVRVPGAAADVAFTVRELRERFPRRTAVVTTQCGGNRRAEMNGAGAGAATAGIAWGGGAISTAEWSGAALRDVLAAAGVAVDDVACEWHVQFVGADGLKASVPAEKALGRTGDVLLAYDMNGGPIPPHHGAPLRAVVPGVVGVRSVKWLTAVTLQPHEADGPWQRGMAYKAFAPGVRSLEGIDVTALPSVQEQPVTSVIALPAPDAAVAVDPADVAPAVVPMRGYAYAGGGRRIVRVDVSADGGATWHTADVAAGGAQPRGRAWAWTLWEAAVPLPRGAAPGDVATLVVKALDEAGNVQPEQVGPIWNLRGLNCNAWHRVRVRLVAPADADDVAEEES